MAASRSHVATLLLLVVAVACSYSILPISAEASVTPNMRLLRQLVEFTDAAAVSAEGEHPNPLSSSSSSSASAHEGAAVQESSGSEEVAHASEIGHSGSGEAAHSAESEHSGSSASHEPKHEGPTMMMFVGPATAGVLAILLIGGVIAFKSRVNK